MKLKVLGPNGGELPGCRSTCFLLDDVFALDAGSLNSTLGIEALARVDDILLTHSHYDHVKDLPLLADVLVGRRETPVNVYSNTECIRTLKKNLFNDEMWPDFTRIPSRRNPVFKLRSFKPGGRVNIGRYSADSIPVNHTVESCGFVVSDGRSRFGISGDTGPTDLLWRRLNKVEGLSLLLLECSFPNALQDLADVSGHLTPRTLERELAKFDRRDCEVLLYHLKPGYVAELKREVRNLPVQVLEIDDTFEF